MLKRIVALQVAAALSVACAVQVDDGSSEPVGRSQSALATGTGATFEQVLTQSVATEDHPDWGKVTSVCEMTIPNVDPADGGLSIHIADFLAGGAGPIDGTYQWTGADLDLTGVGKTRDALLVTGCNEGGDCRLSIRMTTKGVTPDSNVGCQIDVTGSVALTGSSRGNKLVSVNVGGGSGDPLLKAQSRQKMLMNLAGTRLSHQCATRLYTTNPGGMSAGHRAWINNANPGSAVNQTIDAAPGFPTVVDFAPMSDLSQWGIDDVSTKAQHIILRSRGLVPGDLVFCTAVTSDTATDAGSPRHVARYNYNTTPQQTWGMTFQEFRMGHHSFSTPLKGDKPIDPLQTGPDLGDRSHHFRTDEECLGLRVMDEILQLTCLESWIERGGDKTAFHGVDRDQENCR